MPDVSTPAQPPPEPPDAGLPAAESRSGPPAAIAPRPARSLKLNLLYGLGGTGFFNACRFGVVSLIAKCGTPELVGHYSFGFTVASPVVQFFTLNLRGVFISDATNSIPFGSYLRTRTLGVLAAALVLAGVVAWNAAYPRDPVRRSAPTGIAPSVAARDAAAPSSAPASSAILAGGLAMSVILAGVCVGRLIDSEVEIYWGLFLKDERMDRVAWSNAMRGLASIVPFAAALPLAWWLVHRGHADPGAVAWGTALGAAGSVALSLGITLVYDLPLSHRCTLYSAAWSWAQVRALIVRAFPLGVVSLLVTLVPNIPRWALYALPDGDRHLGFFSALSWVVYIGNLFVSQAGVAAANRLAVYFRENMRAFVRLVLKLEALALAMSLPLFLAAMFAGRWILRLLYKPEYADYYPEFMIIVIAQCVSFFSSIFGFATTQMQIYWVQVGIWSAMGVAALCGSWWLIPADPIRGACTTVLMISLVQFVAYLLCLLIGIRLQPRILARVAAADAAQRGVK